MYCLSLYLCTTRPGIALFNTSFWNDRHKMQLRKLPFWVYVVLKNSAATDEIVRFRTVVIVESLSLSFVNPLSFDWTGNTTKKRLEPSREQ